MQTFGERGSGDESEPRKPLRAVELEMLELASEGIAGNDIAKQLHWSRGYLKVRFCYLYQKLGADNRVQAVAIALRRHLIE